MIIVESSKVGTTLRVIPNNHDVDSASRSIIGASGGFNTILAIERSSILLKYGVKTPTAPIIDDLACVHGCMCPHMHPCTCARNMCARILLVMSPNPQVLAQIRT